MESEPGRVRIEPAGGAPSTTVWSVPTVGSQPFGEAPAGFSTVALATAGAGYWLAVPWAGGTGWVVRSDTTPLDRAVGAAEDTAGMPFDWPVGPTPQRSLDAVPPGWYVAVGFAESYQPAPGRRAIHTGLDLNLKTGGDSDLGQPVYATADGVVTASSVWPVWGNIVLLRHELPDGGTLWSQYAHLARRWVRRGQVVARGDQLGTIGKGQGNRFAAHLHFEIRTRDVPAAYWPGLDRAAVLAHYADPRAVLAQPATTLARATQPRGVTVDDRAPWCGKGLFVREPWPMTPGNIEAAGRDWRRAALDFVVLKAAHHDRPYQATLAPWRSARSVDGRPALWGWSTVGGPTPLRELALAAEAADALDAAGWVVEPTSDPPPESATALMIALRHALGERALAVTWRPGVPLRLVRRFAPWVDVWMPWVDGPGSVGMAAAQVARFGRPVVPVLGAHSAPAPAATAFVAHAYASGQAGAAVASADGWRGTDDVPVPTCVGAEPWPGRAEAAAQDHPTIRP